MIKQLTLALLFSATSASDLKQMVQFKWNANDTDTMKANDMDIEHNFNQLARMSDHPDAQGEMDDLQNKLNELGGKLQPSIDAWMQSPEAMDLQAKGQKFFEVRVDTKRNHKLERDMEDDVKDLAEDMEKDSSDYDLYVQGQASRLQIKNKNIMDVTKSAIANKHATEKAVNSQEGQDVMGAVKATAENKQAQDFGNTLEAALNDMAAADPARKGRLEARIQARAQALQQSIEKQLDFMGSTVEVSNTKRLETPKAQKLFEEAASPPQINTAGWK